MKMQVEERKERRKVLAQLLKALTGIQEPPERQKPRRVISRGAQHSELLRWIIVYSERIRELIHDEPTREVAVRDGDAPLKVYNVTFGEERRVCRHHAMEMRLTLANQLAHAEEDSRVSRGANESYDHM